MSEMSYLEKLLDGVEVEWKTLGQTCKIETGKLNANAAVVANDYNLSVSSYVEAKDNREIIDIGELNAELKTTVSKIDQLRKDIDAIVAEIEGCEVQK
ncbi:hypothetical protein BK308_08685 [Escherichia coli]|nr:hypothetical protein BK308_08685 [Escherichia coli]